MLFHLLLWKKKKVNVKGMRGNTEGSAVLEEKQGHGPQYIALHTWAGKQQPKHESMTFNGGKWLMPLVNEGRKGQLTAKPVWSK